MLRDRKRFSAGAAGLILAGLVSATQAGAAGPLERPASLAQLAPPQLLGNPGFENGSANPAPWIATTGVINNSPGEAPHSGTWKAWLDGYGTTHTDSLYQDVTIPPNAVSAVLSFWLHIDTAETTGTTAFDTLKVQIRNTSNVLLSTLATYSNLNAATGFAQKSFDITSYRGQRIRIYFLAIEDSSRQTSFVIDDVAVTIQY